MPAPKAVKLIGHAKPRIAPPVPARNELKEFREVAKRMSIDLMPWQETAARYLTAKAADGSPLYREVCIVVARQQGKTHLMKPFIVDALEKGRKVMHIAQTRELPRVMFGVIAESLPEKLFLKRRGKGGKMQTIWPRYGAGQEEILTANGGAYRIAAASRGGARGQTNDIVIIDELREMVSNDIIAAAEPTLMTSPHAQLIYLSNAGTDDSVVLNEVRARAGQDPALAYLEWSAEASRDPEDIDGWLEANPAIGHIPTTIKSLEASFRRHKLAGTLANFETENLCRWVPTMRERLVDDVAWGKCETDTLPFPRRSYMAVSMDPDGTRASAAVAWPTDDGKTAVRLVFDVTGSPIDTNALGEDMKKRSMELGVRVVGFDPLTDGELAKFFKTSKSISGQQFANGSATFVNAVKGDMLRWHDSDAITADLVWTAKKEHDESGSYQAVRAKDDRPITASLAAIRAVWLASGPRPARPRIY